MNLPNLYSSAASLTVVSISHVEAFVSVAERRGYDRYGEANAPARLAAQAALDQSAEVLVEMMR
jgi:hypothetical protein